MAVQHIAELEARVLRFMAKKTPPAPVREGQCARAASAQARSLNRYRAIGVCQAGITYGIMEPLSSRDADRTP